MSVPALTNNLAMQPWCRRDRPHKLREWCVGERSEGRGVFWQYFRIKRYTYQLCIVFPFFSLTICNFIFFCCEYLFLCAEFLPFQHCLLPFQNCFIIYKWYRHRNLNHSVFVSLSEELYLFRLCTALPLKFGSRYLVRQWSALHIQSKQRFKRGGKSFWLCFLHLAHEKHLH